jgi:hypothetical protein
MTNLGFRYNGDGMFEAPEAIGNSQVRNDALGFTVSCSGAQGFWHFHLTA